MSKWVSTAVATAVLAAVGAVLCTAAGAGARSPVPDFASTAPACSAEEVMRPYIEEAFSEYSDGPPVATQPIHVWIDFHDATDGYHSTDSVRMSGPAGVEVRGDGENRFVVTSPLAGTLTLGLSWEQDRADSSTCSASGDVLLTLKQPKPAVVKFRPGPYPPHTRAGPTGPEVIRGLGYGLRGKINRPRLGFDATPLRLVVRTSGPGTLRPPKKGRGRVLFDELLPMGVRTKGALDLGRLRGPGVRKENSAAKLYVHWRDGSRIYGRPDRYELTVGRDKAKHRKSFCPACRGKRWKVGLTVNVSQGGRLVGWMSSGVRCRLINPFSDLKCKWVHFHKGGGAAQRSLLPIHDRDVRPLAPGRSPGA